jgi:hypothetical protein
MMLSNSINTLCSCKRETHSEWVCSPLGRSMLLTSGAVRP